MNRGKFESNIIQREVCRAAFENDHFNFGQDYIIGGVAKAQACVIVVLSIPWATLQQYCRGLTVAALANNAFNLFVGSLVVADLFITNILHMPRALVTWLQGTV